MLTAVEVPAGQVRYKRHERRTNGRWCIRDRARRLRRNFADDKTPLEQKKIEESSFTSSRRQLLLRPTSPFSKRRFARLGRRPACYPMLSEQPGLCEYLDCGPAHSAFPRRGRPFHPATTISASFNKSHERQRQGRCGCARDTSRTTLNQYTLHAQ